jgi:signal transduction histidine kinase
MLSAISSNVRISIAVTVAVFASGAVFVATEIKGVETSKAYSRIVLATEISSKLSALVGMASDAEASQRGYLLTDRDDYIDGYNAVVPKINPLVMEMRDDYILLGDRSMLNEFNDLAVTLREKLSELELTRTLAQQGKRQLAQELVLTGIGKEKADILRTKVQALQARHSAKISEAIELRKSSQNSSRIAMGIVTVVNMLMLVVFAQWLRRDWRAQDQKQRDLRQQQTILDKLVVERTQELEVLASHLQQVSEREKARIARELHDELGALLTASKMDVSWVRQYLSAEQAELGDRLDRALKNLIDCVHAKRRVIENLVPSTLATFGLVVALREFSTAMQDAAGWTLELDLPDDDIVFPHDVSIALFRIVQESINNIAKYADAKTVWLRLRCDRDIISLEVEDDGVGFNPARVRPDSHGLAGMRQRMVGLRGTLKVNSEVGLGTRVCARLSLGDVALQPSSLNA